MVTRYASIIEHSKEVGPGRWIFTYEWSGDRRWPVIINHEIAASKVLPWPLKCIDKVTRLPYDQAIYVRTDVHWWQWVALKAYAAYHLQHINRRLKLTVNLWGLVNFEWYKNPTWRELLIGWPK